MADQSCEGCRFFCRLPYFDADEEKRSGSYGSCRKQSPFHNGWPTTWGSYWCGDWQKRQHGPNLKDVA